MRSIHRALFLTLLTCGAVTRPGAAQPQARAVQAGERASSDSTTSAALERADLGRIRGRADAPVWVVVMSDFECPYCRTWHDEVEPLIERDYVATGRVRLAYLNYIAVAGHRNAPPAHDAAMCAAEQGRFWEVADLLFDTQPEWRRLSSPGSFFETLLQRARVDLPRHRACVASRLVRPLIDADQARVVRLGMSGTPAFLIGGRRLVGAQPYPVFQQAIDDALRRASMAAPPASPARPAPPAPLAPPAP